MKGSRDIHSLFQTISKLAWILCKHWIAKKQVKNNEDISQDKEVDGKNKPSYLDINSAEA